MTNWVASRVSPGVGIPIAANCRFERVTFGVQIYVILIAFRYAMLRMVLERNCHRYQL